MTTGISVVSINPKNLNHQQKESLVKELYAIHNTIFDGTTEHHFRKYVIDSEAEVTKVRLYKSGEQIIGYSALHFFETHPNGKKCTIIRGETGFLPQFRRKGILVNSTIFEPVKYKILNPFRKTYVFGSFVHPAMYLTLAKFCWKMYPHPRREIPRKYQKMMLDFANRYNLPEVPSCSPFVRRVGWICREEESEKSRWSKTENTIARYYVETNPDYTLGNGLLILTPVTFLNIALSLSIYLKKKYANPRLKSVRRK